MTGKFMLAQRHQGAKRQGITIYQQKTGTVKVLRIQSLYQSQLSSTLPPHYLSGLLANTGLTNGVQSVPTSPALHPFVKMFNNTTPALSRPLQRGREPECRDTYILPGMSGCSLPGYWLFSASFRPGALAREYFFLQRQPPIH
jgi:hypothetical protein